MSEQSTTGEQAEGQRKWHRGWIRDDLTFADGVTVGVCLAFIIDKIFRVLT